MLLALSKPQTFKYQLSRLMQVFSDEEVTISSLYKIHNLFVRCLEEHQSN